MAKNDFGQFLGGLLDAFGKAYISERDKNREQERLNREEARQEALLSLQKLQNKQRVNEFNKTFEFQKNQANIENVRNEDKIRFDKLIAQKEMFKQYAPLSSMPKSTDGFVFDQTIPGTIDDDFANVTGIDLLKNNEKYYDVNAYKDAYSMYLDRLRTNIYANQVNGSQSKGRIAVVHKPSGTIKLIKESEYYDKVDQGYYPMDTWIPMTIEQASTLGMSQMGFDKSGKLLSPTSTPGQVADVFAGALENASADWFNKIFTNQTGETLNAQDILNRLKPSGLKNIENFNFRGGQFGGAGIQPEDVRKIKEFNNQKWTAQRNANTQGISGFLQNTIQPLREALNFSNTWKDTPAGREQRKAMELQVANLVEPLAIAYQGVDSGLISKSVKEDVYNALQFAKQFARKNTVTLELMRKNAYNQAETKEQVKEQFGK